MATKLLARHLHKQFCKKYGNLIDEWVAEEYLNYIDDLREVSDKSVDYLYDYAMEKGY